MKRCGLFWSLQALPKLLSHQRRCFLPGHKVAEDKVFKQDLIRIKTKISLARKERETKAQRGNQKLPSLSISGDGWDEGSLSKDGEITSVLGIVRDLWDFRVSCLNPEVCSCGDAHWC